MPAQIFSPNITGTGHHSAVKTSGGVKPEHTVRFNDLLVARGMEIASALFGCAKTPSAEFVLLSYICIKTRMEWVMAANDPSESQISREAGDKQKGFRFQKLRAAIRFIQRVEASTSAQVLCAIEFLEDSFLYEGIGPNSISGEENKSYGSAISFNTGAIKNTLVAFIDLYCAFAQSKDLKLGVYASAAIAQERIEADAHARLGFDKKQTHYSILRKLVDGEDLTIEDKIVVHYLATTEYRLQYPDLRTGWRALLDQWSVEDFAQFLKNIEWSVSPETNDALETAALTSIRSSRFFSFRHSGLEAFILAKLLDEFEKRSHQKDRASRLLGTDALALIFRDVLGSAGLAAEAARKPQDPAAETWASISPIDTRNLATKILAVSPAYSKHDLQKLAIKCTLARSEESIDGREYIALRRRILDACEDQLRNISKSTPMTPNDVNGAIDQLTAASHAHITSISQKFAYSHRDQLTIRGTVLTLFDDCFLAFDDANE